MTIQRKKGFTLIELLIVIAVIAILAAVVFVALNPLGRFQDARDSRRWSDINAIAQAIKTHQVDNGGAYLTAISSATTGTVYIIGTDTTGCNTYTCDVNATSTAACIDLSGLATAGYLGSVPMSPNGAGTWTAGHTGYTLERETTGIVHIAACESENTASISVSR